MDRSAARNGVPATEWRVRKQRYRPEPSSFFSINTVSQEQTTDLCSCYSVVTSLTNVFTSRYSDSPQAGRFQNRIPEETRLSARVHTGLGVKRSGRSVNHPPPSSAEVKETVELYLYSLHWVFMVCSKATFTSPFFSLYSILDK